MKNRSFRKHLTTYKGRLIVDTNCSVEEINANLLALKIVMRYNSIKVNAQRREQAKTHVAQPMYNMIGNYIGHHWKRR